MTVDFSTMTPQQMYAMYGAGAQNAYMGGVPQQMMAAQTGGFPVQMQGQLKEDTFQKSSPGGLGVIAATAGAGAAAGAGLGGFFLNNPVTKGEGGKLVINPDVYKNYDDNLIDKAIKDAIDEKELSKIKDAGVSSKEEYEALKKLADAESFDKLPDDVKSKLKDSTIKTPDDAKKKVETIKEAFGKLDRAKIAEDAAKDVKGLVGNKVEFLNNYEATQKALKDLGTKATPEQLEEFIRNNEKMFGLTGKSEDEIAKEIDRLKKMKPKEIAKELADNKTSFETIVKDARTKILGAVDTKTGKLSEGASNEMKEVFKNFKISQAKKYGKWGALAGGAMALLYSVFA